MSSVSKDFQINVLLYYKDTKYRNRNMVRTSIKGIFHHKSLSTYKAKSKKTTVNYLLFEDFFSIFTSTLVI